MVGTSKKCNDSCIGFPLYVCARRGNNGFGDSSFQRWIFDLNRELVVTDAELRPFLQNSADVSAVVMVHLLAGLFGSLWNTLDGSNVVAALEDDGYDSQENEQRSEEGERPERVYAEE